MYTYTERNRFIMLLLFHAFGGWYNLYWIYSVQNEVRKIEGKGKDGFMEAVLCFVTFGVYAFVWQWKVCGILKKQGAKDLRILTLILGICLFGIIINPLIMQGQMNMLANRCRIRLY